MKKFFHSISTMMLLVALTGMGLASCSESPEAPEDPTENPDDEDKGDGSEGEGGDENKTVELNYTVAEAAYWGDDYMEDGTSNLIVYLYDSPRDEDGVHTGPKDHFNIDMNLPNFNGGELLIPARSLSDRRTRSICAQYARTRLRRRIRDRRCPLRRLLRCLPPGHRRRAERNL